MTLFAGPVDLASIYTPQVAIQTGAIFRPGDLSIALGVPYLVRADINRLIAQRVRGSLADVPLGTTVGIRSLEEQPLPSLPAVAQPTAGGQVPPLSAAGRSQPPPSVQTVIPAQSITEEQTMDLGNILSQVGQAVDIYGQFRRIRGGQFPVMGAQQQLVGATVATPDIYGVAPQPALLPALPMAIGGVASQGGRIAAAIAGLGIGLTAEEIAAIAGVASKVKCRRRRRRLATHSDIKDLAALKAVLGSGKAFDTWIATRKM